VDRDGHWVNVHDSCGGDAGVTRISLWISTTFLLAMNSHALDFLALAVACLSDRMFDSLRLVGSFAAFLHDDGPA
jgi:hypothetical protein